MAGTQKAVKHYRFGTKWTYFFEMQVHDVRPYHEIQLNADTIHSLTLSIERLLRLLKNEPVTEIIQTTRLGITKGHSCNEHLEYRFIDAAFVSKCTKNPLTMRNNKPTVTIIQNHKPIAS